MINQDDFLFIVAHREKPARGRGETNSDQFTKQASGVSNDPEIRRAGVPPVKLINGERGQ